MPSLSSACGGTKQCAAANARHFRCNDKEVQLKISKGHPPGNWLLQETDPDRSRKSHGYDNATQVADMCRMIAKSANWAHQVGQMLEQHCRKSGTRTGSDSHLETYHKLDKELRKARVNSLGDRNRDPGHQASTRREETNYSGREGEACEAKGECQLQPGHRTPRQSLCVRSMSLLWTSVRSLW